MKFIISLSIERQNREPSLLCGDLERLVVVVFTRDDSDNSVIVHGVDPNHVDPVHDRPVFTAQMPRARLGSFLKTVIDGDQPSLAAASLVSMPAATTLPSASDFTVDVPGGDPTPGGPKLPLVFACARALRIDEIGAGVGAAEPPMRSVSVGRR